MPALRVLEKIEMPFATLKPIIKLYELQLRFEVNVRSEIPLARLAPRPDETSANAESTKPSARDQYRAIAKPRKHSRRLAIMRRPRHYL